MEINTNDIASVQGWFLKVSEGCRATLQVTGCCSNAQSRFLILCPSCHSRKNEILSKRAKPSCLSPVQIGDDLQLNKVKVVKEKTS
jgi:hypothetical protein